MLSPFILILTIGCCIHWRRNKINKRTKFYIVGLIFIFLLEFGNSIFIQERLSPPEEPIAIKVMSYNLFFKNKYPAQSISIINKESPDLLFVQELTPAWSEHLSRSLSETYPFKSLIAINGTHGIGVYSKHKISSVTKLVNDNKKPYAQIIKMKLAGKETLFINTHLASPAIAVENKDRFFSLYAQNYALRKSQLKEINDYANKTKNAFDSQLIIGDLNTMKYEPIHKALLWDWVDTYQKVGKGLGWNFPNTTKLSPFITLDYILGRGEMKCIDAKVVEGGSSDHLAIMATLKI